jgi:hypothetical protein
VNAGMRDWPAWWGWEIELTSHLLKRMLDRRFAEADLRQMLAAASGVREGDAPGRWVVRTTHDSVPWEVVLEPDPIDRLLVVITAYPVDES